MENTNNTNERVSDFYNPDSTPTRDSSLDISALIKTAKADSNMKVAADDTAATVKKVASPLEQMMQEQQEGNKGSGMVVTNEELEKGQEKTSFQNNAYNETRMNAIEERMKEMDATYEKRKNVVVLKFPEMETPQFTQMMMEIDSLKRREDGTLYFDIHNPDGSLKEPEYVRLRTEEDGPFVDAATDMALARGENSSTEEKTTESENTEEENGEEISDEKKNIVNVLIDKTGLGIDFKFSEEEKAKLYEAQEIRLTEVEFMDIESINMATRTDKSFQESVEEFEFANSKITVCFPGSGFRAQMKGMTYGEMGDVALSMDRVTFDQYYKRLSVIYNKMTNISTGPFKDFEDFLKNFSYADIPMALYGLYVATQPEIQQIQLRCGGDNCHKEFDWKFNTRSVLRLEDCSDTFLKKMEELATAPPTDYDKIRERSSVKTSKFIRLPYSKIIVELGLVSAYEFLYNFIPATDPDTFRAAFGDDPNNIYTQNLLLLSTLRSVRVPLKDGSYVLYDTYKDMLDAIYDISPEEIKIITAISNKLMGEYQSTFAIKNVVCPHCGNETKVVEVTMDDLVFQTYQRLMTTEINVENMQVL